MYLNNQFIRNMAVICVLLAGFVFGTGCRGEPESPKEKIESITFDKERIEIKINEEATVRVTVKSDEAKKNEIIVYTSVNEGIIEIREPTNDGFIVKGLRGGTTVITAKSKLVTSYFEVDVKEDNILAQYITVAQPVIEMLEGELYSTQVSLYNGSVLDNNDFVWRLENGKDNISIDVSANIAVISGLQRGYQKIMVSHPKAEYESEILVFVTGLEEKIKYISSPSNVILVPNNGQYHDFEVVLINGDPEDVINFNHVITEGSENIHVVSNANVFNIKGNKSGTSVLRIKHPLAVVDFDLRIIVYDIDIPYIVLEQTFLLMNIGDSRNVGATVENARNGILSNSQFSYIIMEDNVAVNGESGILELIQNNNSFYIRAKRGGNARIIISNEQAETAREILVVVREELVYRDDYYITTTQNVIMTQAGAEAIQLKMQLVNGNNADANGFEWVVDDGTIITVESAHGIVRNSRAAIDTVFNALAVITPKKAGTAKITVSHKKSEVTAAVMVKVYPKGTFVVQPILVGFEGLIKVKSGAPTDDPDRSPKTIQLRMVSGDIHDVGSLNWTMADTNIATVNNEAHGTINIANAVNNGLTRMIVNGNNLEHPHESLVLAGTPDFVDNTSVIYVDSIYQNMVTEQTVRIEVKDSNNLYNNSNDFNVEIANKNVLYAVMIKNQLVLQGKSVGETQVRISHSSAINDITLNVRIDPAYINIDKPYYISGPEIKGVVRGRWYNGSIEFDQPVKVSLVGAGESDIGRLVWSIDDTGVADIVANGGECWVMGKVSNRQTKIRVSHPKAENEKVIILYVVENDADLNNKVVLGLASENYLLTRGQEQLISLITNANDKQKSGLTWKIRHEAEGVLTNGVISINPHYDSAMITAMGAGNAEIVVTHADNIIPLSVYVSVVDGLSTEKFIRGPAIIELIKDESKIITLSTSNLSSVETGNIRWAIENESLGIANLQENGDSAYMLGLKKGVDFVNIRQDAIGYRHRSTLVCANTAEELASMYVIGVDASYYGMMAGDEKKINLSFGSAGFPEGAKSTIRWTADQTGVVRVVGQGESATIVAVNEGIGKVTVESPTSFNSLELTFEVRGFMAGVYEFRGHDKIKGIVVGNTAQIMMRIWNGDNEITSGYSLLQYENESDNIITINPVDNIINITANTVGQSYITVRHKQVNEAARILVYTANTADELANYYPILVEKTNYLLQIGETTTVKLETISNKDNVIDDNGRTKFQNISWGIENANVIENVNFNGQKEVVVKARAEGQCILNISYKGNVIEKIFIMVIGNDTIDMAKYILTENIIGIKKGENYSTKIFHNLGGDVNAVLWESEDQSIVTVNGAGENGTLTAVNNGETYVTVSYGSWLKRHILVYVCNDKPQIDAYKAMNMENQYYRAGLNETLILPLFFAPNKPNVPTLWIDKYDNKVARFNALQNGGRLEITTLNEGVAVLEANNTGLSYPGRVLRIYIEVSKRYNNAPKAPELKYLTIEKTVYVMNPDEINVPLNLSVSGIGMTGDELAKVKWEIESGSQYIAITYNGKECQVMVNRFGYEGEAELKAYYIDNTVRVKIIVSRTGLMGFPHIVGEDIIRIGLGNKLLMEYNVAEIASYDKNLFAVEIVGNGGNVVGAKMTGNMLEVEGKISGQALLRINCRPACEFAKEVIVIVTTTPDGLVYLTTMDNFCQVKINEIKTLAVEMVGYENSGDQGYEWTVDPAHKSYVDLHFTGRQAQIKGLADGAGKTAKIVISNKFIDPLFNLAVYVRVSNTDINTTYITTQRNIISVVEGRSVYLDAELVNGAPGEENLFVWSSLNANILGIEGAGSQVIVLGKQIGIGRVRVNHPSAVNTGMEILVIVEKDMTGSGIYITADSTLVDIRPNETKQLEVRLAGGNPEDIYGFLWNIASYESVNKVNGKSQPVVNLVPNADKAYINGLNEGEATVRVTHPRTNYVLDIKVYVRLYSTIRFVQRNVSVEVGKNLTVPVEAPAGIAVAYTAGKYRDPVTGVSRNVVNVSGTNSVCVIEGIAEGICIVYASDARGTMTDELVVQVQPSTNRVVRYIQTSDTIYNMTDWQSALNRMMIEGTTVGEKDNGHEFTAADDPGIVWNITTGKEVIGFGDGLSKKDSSIGKMVSVYTKSVPGNGEITVTHPLMPEYRKNIYVNVYPHDSNFSITPVFLDMQIGEVKTIEAFLNNLADKPYRLINWEAKGKGIEIADIRNEGKTVDIRALTDGVYKVEASFNGSFPPIEVTVFIEKKKTFEIMDDSFILLLPGQTRFIGLHVDPLEWDGSVNVNFRTDYLDYAKIEFITAINKIPGNFLPLYNPSIMREGVNAVLCITGKEREGYTKIIMTSSNIERMVTINTNYNYMFCMAGVEENGVLRETNVVRGQPNQKVTVVYNVYPEFDKVNLINDTNKQYNILGGNRNTIARNVNVRSNEQKIDMILDNCGYAEIVFKSQYNEKAGMNMTIPVYVYYDRIEFQWEGTERKKTHAGKNFKSRVDSVNNAIYIADHEQMNIDFIKGSDGFPVNQPGFWGTSQYYGADFEMDSQNTSSMTQNNTQGDDINYVNVVTTPPDTSGKATVYVHYDMAAETPEYSNTGYDILKSVDYVGILRINYKYSTGNATKTAFYKNFMVYREIWLRRKQ